MNPPLPSRPDRATRGAAGRALRSGAALLVALAASGCDKDLSKQYQLVLRVSSELDHGVVGARASLAGRALGSSDASGALHIQLRGREGEVVPIEVECPPGHRSPPAVRVPLRQVGRNADGHDVTPEFTATCTPLTHSIVVALRAENGPNLPLLHLGRELARTDSSGAAHLRLDVASDEVVELVLDTSEQPRLRPRNPIVRLPPGQRDEITAVDQKLSVLPRPATKKLTVPHGPTRIE